MVFAVADDVFEGGGIPYYLNTDISSAQKSDPEALQQLANEVKSLGALGLNISYSLATKLLVDIMHDNGLLVSLWTANTKNVMQVALSLAPDNITTRHPDILLEIIAKRQQLG